MSPSQDEPQKERDKVSCVPIFPSSLGDSATPGRVHAKGFTSPRSSSPCTPEENSAFVNSDGELSRGQLWLTRTSVMWDDDTLLSLLHGSFEGGSESHQGTAMAQSQVGASCEFSAASAL